MTMLRIVFSFQGIQSFSFITLKSLLLACLINSNIWGQITTQERYVVGGLVVGSLLPTQSEQDAFGISYGGGLGFGIQFKKISISSSFLVAFHNLDDDLPVYVNDSLRTVNTGGMSTGSIYFGFRPYFSRRHEVFMNLGLGASYFGYYSSDEDNMTNLIKWTIKPSINVMYRWTSKPSAESWPGKNGAKYIGLGVEYFLGNFRFEDNRNPQFTGNFILLTLELGTKGYDWFKK